MSDRFQLPLLSLLALVLFAGIAPEVQAQRVSLGEMDAKLNLLVAGTFDRTNHVTLSAWGSSTSSCPWDRAYFRVNLDGTRDTNEFVVPANHTLFLTDISWRAWDNPTTFTAGRTLNFHLLAQNVNGGNSQAVYQSHPMELTSAILNASLGANETVRAGVPVGEGRIVCASISSFSQSGGSAHTVSNSILRGILVPDS